MHNKTPSIQKKRRIALLGDFNPNFSTHLALNNSLRHFSTWLGKEIPIDWIGTDLFDFNRAFQHDYSGLWIAPGSPYKNTQNVLDTITYARTNNIPTLGNCGGFQHILIEFARNVCGIAHADHEETHPGSSDLVISKLSCSLVEQEETLTITDKQSLLYKIIQKETLLGKYFCSYGLNPAYVDTLTRNGLSPTALSPDNHVRAFEIKSHPFLLGTLFQPALTSTVEQPDPIILAFIKKCLD